MTLRSEPENAEVEARWEEFWRDHENYDPSWARDVLHCWAETTTFIFKFGAVDRTLPGLYKHCGVKFPRNTDWIGASDELPVSELQKLPIFRLALALQAYAYYGLRLKVDEADENELHGLDAFLEDLDHQGVFPKNWIQIDDENSDDKISKIYKAVLAAEGRRKLDHGWGEGLKREELAALARVNIKTINNLVAPNSDSELRMVDKKIPLEIARSWLQTRDEFRPTLGKKPEDRIQDPKGDEELVGIAVFVPALDDDTWFSPLESFVPRKTVRGGPKKPSGDNRIYRVGDVNFDNYWSALDAVNQLQVPRWRHLDTIDRAREIVATGWIRKTRQELDELLNSIPQSTPDKTSRRRGS